MKKTILLTGASGFIGTQIARCLLEDERLIILALVRARNIPEGRRRLARSWWDWPELVNALGSRIEVLCGDVCLPRLGLDETTYAETIGKVTHIIHTAADWRLIPLDQLRRTNVQGTANVIDFAREVNRHHCLERLSHISTAYVAGSRTGSVPESDLTDAFGFSTDYERSKYEGELLVQAAKTDLPVSVFRPSMVIGDSNTGTIKTFNTFYFPLRLYLTGRMRFIPVSRTFRVNIVPVDYVAGAVTRLTFDPRAEGANFHLVAPYESLPTIREVLDFIHGWAKENLSVELPRPFYVGLSASSTATLMRFRRAFQRKTRRESDALISLSSYFSESRQFQRENVDRLLGSYDMKWREIFPHLLDYAIYNSFFHRSERTVYEQVLFRLDGKSYPITFYDLADGMKLKKTPEEMRQDILAATSALKKLGIVHGDRVALVGFNSARYLAVDIAIGLAGAVSVPLYYTAPPADINHILQASGAKILFIGTPTLLSRVNDLSVDIPLISICRGTLPQDLEGKVTAWDDFLSKAKGEVIHIKEATVGFDDIATLRYSSGTTGRPKGAIFRHDNLRYMAESTVSLIPWHARTRRCTYLSFLPMSHVVEGILAAYSPYYIPAPVDIYFLENFRQLQKTLPQVRPTIFFSVPRIYEKVWEGLEKNAFGRMYAARRKGLLKRAMGIIVKSMTLKRAGLSKCALLIAGSARFDTDLLLKYRELGIEIHNAYGLTEAPLITTNRVGRNKPGTLGTPMPMTQIKTADDEEIMVKGPQVTVGYFDKTLESPFRDGWLMTGDMGTVTNDGSLVLHGRKKELIKTSYGKCIYSGKIEDMMREIPGVAEAMLVGESMPYCGALIWVDKDQWSEKTLESIDKAMVSVNERLSNPEKVKKWALLVNHLSIENGDLTPNLKLKRNLMSVRHAGVIDSLYGGVIPEGELHISGVDRLRRLP